MSVEFIHVNDPNSVRRYNMSMKKKPTMVLFYMDGCGHCEAMKPEWKVFEKEAQKRKHDCLVARVNGDYMSDIEGPKDIIGYPTIFRIMNGVKQAEHHGPRTKDEFMRFLIESEIPQRGGKIRRRRKRRTRRRRKRSRRRRTKRRKR